MKPIRRILSIFAVCFLLSAQTRVNSPNDDIAGDGTPHAIGTGAAKWIQIVAPSTNVSAVRWGDSSISNTRGGTIAPGGGQMLPFRPMTSDRYDLSQVYYRVAVGDKVSITWAN
jgi:hypothetical protein